MRFDRLKNSIEINSSEEPSVYMALCLLETVFRDIKDEVNDVSDLAVGDDTWPLKMSLIYRTLNKIVDANQSSINRGQEQLLEKKSQADKNLAELDAKYQSGLDEQTRISEEIRLKNEEINGLAEAIEQKKSELSDLIAKKEELDSKASLVDKEISKIKAAIDDLEVERTNEEKHRQLVQLQDQVIAFEKEIEDRNTSISKYEQELGPLSAESEKLKKLNVAYEEKKKEYEYVISKYSFLSDDEYELKTKQYASQSEIIINKVNALCLVISEITEITGKKLSAEDEAVYIKESMAAISSVLEQYRNELSNLSKTIKNEVLSK